MEGCGNNTWSRGWCSGHYHRWKKYGDPVHYQQGPRHRDFFRYFLERCTIGDDCWEWIGRKQPNGYGKLANDYVHRLSYMEFVGPIPKTLEIDHLCRNRACIRPDHLEAVTRKVNLNRGAGNGGVLSSKQIRRKI